MRPLPPVGARVQLIYPGRNINNWKHPGTVRAVVGECMLVERIRGGAHEGEVQWKAITQDEWEVFDPARPGGGGLVLLEPEGEPACPICSPCSTCTPRKRGILPKHVSHFRVEPDNEAHAMRAAQGACGIRVADERQWARHFTLEPGNTTCPACLVCLVRG